MKIVTYDPKYKEAFIQYNIDWILDHFGKLEKEDLETSEQIDNELLESGMIYFAVDDNDAVLATCMAKPMEQGTWEICKLASNKHRPHSGCGSAVFEAAMNGAISHGAKKLFIISNRMLKPALHIYEKFGFHEIILDDYGYDRGNIAFERLIEE